MLASKSCYLVHDLPTYDYIPSCLFISYRHPSLHFTVLEAYLFSRIFGILKQWEDLQAVMAQQDRDFETLVAETIANTDSVYIDNDAPKG